MDDEQRKDLIRKFGTAGRNVYAHLACEMDLLERAAAEGGVVQPDRTKRWSPKELLGRYPDITHCDACGRAFGPGDPGYISHWLVSPDELRLWREIALEKH